MNRILIEGRRIAYEERGGGEHAIVFLHDWACNHRHFSAQMESLARLYRVIAPDLRGHGESDAPDEEYTLERFSTDILDLCETLDLQKPLLVGHGMGGMVALETAGRYPDLASGVMLIDSLLLPGTDVVNALDMMHRYLMIDHDRAIDEAAIFLKIPPQNTRLGFEITQGMKSCKPQVALSAFRHHILNYDPEASIRACRVPSVYIRALSGAANLERLQQIWPGLLVAQTLKSGHFAMQEVTDQIHAMIRRFAYLTWGDEKLTPPPEALDSMRLLQMAIAPPVEL